MEEKDIKLGKGYCPDNAVNRMFNFAYSKDYINAEKYINGIIGKCIGKYTDEVVETLKKARDYLNNKIEELESKIIDLQTEIKSKERIIRMQLRELKERRMKIEELESRRDRDE